MGQVGGGDRRRAFLRLNMGDSTTRRHMLRWQRGPPWGIYRGAVSTGEVRWRVRGERVWKTWSGGGWAEFVVWV